MKTSRYEMKTKFEDIVGVLTSVAEEMLMTQLGTTAEMQGGVDSLFWIALKLPCVCAVGAQVSAAACAAKNKRLRFLIVYAVHRYNLITSSRRLYDGALSI